VADLAEQREVLTPKVLIIGAGAAGLSCALHLARLIERHRQARHSASLSPGNIYVLEKGRELGSHQLSGAILDPRALRELIPDLPNLLPFGTSVTSDAVYFLTASRAWRSPYRPRPLRNHGNHIVSVSDLVKWLGALAEKAGVTIFTQTAGKELLYEKQGIAGVITDDKGVDRNGRRKANFTPGYELRAKVTVLAEGPRGSLTKDLVNHFRLDGTNPQIYAIGIKELWKIAPGRIRTGQVVHTLGWPLRSEFFGGGWLYGMSGNRLSVGLVVGLEYHDSLFDAHAAFQKFKTHPFVRRLLDGGELIRYGAKVLPEGGWYSMPRMYVDGGLVIGDSAGLVNSERLKGIHIAMKSGMLAAETIFEALESGDFSGQALSALKTKIDRSWIKQELRPVRNFHQGFRRGLFRGLAHGAIQRMTRGRGVADPMRVRAGHEEYYKLEGEPPPFSRTRGDGVLTFDPLTDVYYSGTRHEEDQPCHLVILQPDICQGRCRREYGNPCQYFCPAAVYEMVQEQGEYHLKIHASNCVHCKSCDIADPYQIINWIPPEGGGGPNYVEM
jgi:electron-transferring-flavoprotein dehydrogenase